VRNGADGNGLFIGSMLWKSTVDRLLHKQAVEVKFRYEHSEENSINSRHINGGTEKLLSGQGYKVN
jgi:hypothetical protein